MPGFQDTLRKTTYVDKSSISAESADDWQPGARPASGTNQMDGICLALSAIGRTIRKPNRGDGSSVTNDL